MTKLTWKRSGVLADEKENDLPRCSSGSYFAMNPLTMTVLAVPCSPINRTAFKESEKKNTKWNTEEMHNPISSLVI